MRCSCWKGSQKWTWAGLRRMERKNNNFLHIVLYTLWKAFFHLFSHLSLEIRPWGGIIAPFYKWEKWRLRKFMGMICQVPCGEVALQVRGFWLRPVFFPPCHTISRGAERRKGILGGGTEWAKSWRLKWAYKDYEKVSGLINILVVVALEANCSYPLTCSCHSQCNKMVSLEGSQAWEQTPGGSDYPSRPLRVTRSPIRGLKSQHPGTAEAKFRWLGARCMHKAERTLLVRDPGRGRLILMSQRGQSPRAALCSRACPRTVPP